MAHVAPHFLNNVLLVTRLNREINFPWHNIWCVWTMLHVAPRIAKSVYLWRRLIMSFFSFFVAGAIFGDVGEIFFVFRALQITFHMWWRSIMAGAAAAFGYVREAPLFMMTRVSAFKWKLGKETGGKKMEDPHSLKSNQIAQCSFQVEVRRLPPYCPAWWCFAEGDDKAGKKKWVLCCID